MKKIIINADDLGMSGTVNREIESCIQKGLITSTTIMANMPDFEGARKLYETYKDAISFGWHMNLTEGEPLTKSQALLDFGYFVETKDGVRMNGMAFWKQKFFPKTIREEIKKELRAQIGKIRDNGIRLSHADSHQHIHTSPALLLKVFERLRHDWLQMAANQDGRYVWALARLSFKPCALQG